MDLTQIIAELENFQGKFPRQALEEAIQQQEAITPLLLASLNKWKNNLEELSELPDYFLHIYALLLLAQFKETKAYPVIIEFFSTPGYISLDVTGDLVTEHLGRIFADVSNGNIEPIKQLIENTEANEFVRGAGLHALMALMVQGVISRESVIEYFQQFFTTLFQQEASSDNEEPSYILSDLVIKSAKLYPLELKPDIDRAFELDLIDPFFVEGEDIDYYLQLGKDKTLDELRNDSYYSPIEDTISEMEYWACFQDSKPARNKPLGLGKSSFTAKKSDRSKKKAKKKMQKQARRKNRSKKK